MTIDCRCSAYARAVAVLRTLVVTHTNRKVPHSPAFSVRVRDDNPWKGTLRQGWGLW
jgi:hypothetical protein